MTHLPADIVGHVTSLQRAMPVLVSTSWMTWIMPASNRFISTTASVSKLLAYQSSLLTLMCQPFTKIDIFWLCSEGEKVASD